ncbi:leucine efflux protein [Streptosporangium becharense]|uniref:Leucine efflux protein n=1 Tax=Streptosporangium becharense TaxID=1816182 RepID=A0A7W9MFD4_9ACTN|nr:leucine efflux protein LeuE [Streptosporangium becharense]MBB2910108.1 leucine efflux protein [Streptosporangium becharense]MBB5818937.1 leucine efflux protein [Streptosporangium becharense]
MFFGITDIWTYVVGAFFIILLPGPNSLYVLSTAAQRGVGQGYRAALGVFLGDTVLMVLAAAGAASLLQSMPLLFGVVKYAGAAYLAWIGFQMLRGAWRSWRSPETRAEAEPAPERDAGSPFRKALVISLMNPKAILFFISFFIQFVDPSYGAPALSFLILGAICQLFSVLYLSTLIFGGTFLAARFRDRRRTAATLRTGVGVLFIGFGAKLATATLG